MYTHYYRTVRSNVLSKFNTIPGGDKGPTEHTATACIYLEAMGISKLRVGLWPAVGTICIIHSNEPAEQLSKFPYRKVKKPPSATSPIRQWQRVCGS